MRGEVRSGGCGDGESGETMPEVSQGRIVGLDSDRVIDDSTNDTIGILSHEGADATDRPYQGACDRQSLPSGVKMRENVQNEANPESTQSSLPLGVELSVPEPPGRKRSQRGGVNAPRFTPHPHSGQWIRREWRVASGDIEDGERERSEPTQEETPASEKAQNEANSESTQGSLPLEVESSATESAGRKRSQSATGGVLPHVEDGGERIVAGGL